MIKRIRENPGDSRRRRCDGTIPSREPFLPGDKSRRRSVVRTSTSRRRKPEPSGDLTGIIR
ncbi:hypothetical protein HID58_040284 [Brassica napus]|uniref:Uncharacterized protein n=1 Tax=Brassica napus TaxID=3708 RepID=A0ABQ8B7K6_BRANA|nr:hypothetical protein HID58_040284 [Brassica napus]